jgi:tetratricopeptide (TPR) repeat protein
MVQAFRDHYQLFGQECYFLIDRDASIEDYFPLYNLPRIHLVNEFGMIWGTVPDPLLPTDQLESFLRTRPLEDLPKTMANIPTIRDMKRKMEEAQEETIENKFDLAHGYFLNGKGKVSAAILEEIIELQPEHPKAHFRRGVILWELGMKDKAMEHLLLARDLSKNNEIYRKRIQILEKPEAFYSKEQLNFKPSSTTNGSE